MQHGIHGIRSPSSARSAMRTLHAAAFPPRGRCTQHVGSGTIGEWSLDKRHYGGAYPPRHMQPPPSGASDGTAWLLEAWNEASGNISTWPESLAMGTVGWRRVKGQGIDGSPLASRVSGTEWSWANIPGLAFHPGGELKTPWGSGVWGAAPKGVDFHDKGFCASAAEGCLFADFGGALHNIRFEADLRRFDSFRLGDGTNVKGERKA